MQKREQVTLGFRKTIEHLFEALVNETATEVCWNGSTTNLIAQIPNLKNVQRRHSISVKCGKNPFSGDVERFQWETMFIDGLPINDLSNLTNLGFDETQKAILQQNIDATDHLENVYEQCRTQSPKIFQILAKLLEIDSISKFDRSDPSAFAKLLAQLPSREALILSETCGNVDGSTGNPIKNVMFGPKPNAIAHHPIAVAFHRGLSQIQLVSFGNAEIIEVGTIPERFIDDFRFFTEHRLIPMNLYAVEVDDRSTNVQNSIDAFVLLSKRSLMPLKGDYQIKTSFPAQITSEIRSIDWTTAEDAIECAKIVAQLATMKKLPENLWVLPTFFAGQVKANHHTTFYIRGGLRDAYNNTSELGVPQNLTPVIACALTTRNLLTPERTLFESLVDFGFDPMKLFRDISDAIIGAQLHFIDIRWIPDAHTQNIAYLFDLKAKTFAGLLLKDSECEKNKIIRGGKLASNIFNPNSKPVSEEKFQQRLIISTLYFHHTIYTKHIEPLARLLNEKYDIEIDDLQKIVHQSLTFWLNKHPNAQIREKIDLTGRYYERNLACKTLKIGDPPYYRLIENHKLLPNIYS